MPQQKKENRKTTEVAEYITVAFAEDMDLAKQYQELLEGNDINVRIKRQPEMAQSGFSDIAIMVPEDFLDEAHALISEKNSCDDFFDMIFEDQDSGQLDRSDDYDMREEDLY